MGTSNFARPQHVSCTYAILLNRYDEENDEYNTPDSDDVDAVKENIRDMLFEKDKDNYSFESSFGRACEKQALGEFRLGVTVGEIDIDIQVVPYFDPGYYEGANLDISLLYEGDEYESTDDIVSDVVQYFDPENPGLFAIHSKLIVPKLEKLFDSYVKKIEEVFSDVSEEKLRRIGTASNGETFYETCKS